MRTFKKDWAEKQFETMSNAFMTLGQHTRDRATERCKVYDYWITEESMRENFGKVFGSDCDIMAKLLYVKMSGMRERAKISFMEFITLFIPLYNDNVNVRSKAIFSIIDSDSDGVLCIISLL